jgi:hypothetical protein
MTIHQTTAPIVGRSRDDNKLVFGRVCFRYSRDIDFLFHRRWRHYDWEYSNNFRVYYVWLVIVFVYGCNALRKDNKDLLAAIKKLPDDAVLGCFCKPRACHGDVIIELKNAEIKL